MQLSILPLQVMRGQLVEADVAVKSFEFRVVAAPFSVGVIP